MSVGIVFVSHSAKIAEGLVDLARQMAPTVALIAAGGTEDGGIGTSFDLVTAAIGQADSGEGVAVLCDLGSAILTAETAIDLLDEDDRSRVRILDAPLVEGGVAASVAAEAGADLAGVADAAASADSVDPRSADEPDAPPAPPQGLDEVDVEPEGPISDTAVLINREGLHARPAAEFVKLASTFDAAVTVNGVDAKSLLRIMALGLTEGDEVAVSATGPQAADAIRALAELVRSGFGEA